uniref:Uncharacterized protein n=1 Tax=Denticeps clupeoides TaxID=299321 RepID=A0AAY4DB82_9TELE
MNKPGGQTHFLSQRISLQLRCLSATHRRSCDMAQPLHWNYNLEKLKALLDKTEPCPEFRPQSANPFYLRQTGKQSCYGDQAFVLLDSLCECGGLDIEDLTKRTYKSFGPGSDYDLPVNDPYRPKDGPRPSLPIPGPWRNASLKAFIRNVDSGKAETGCNVDNQIDGVTRLAPIVALYAGRPEMLARVEDALRVTQNNDMCVAVTLAAARFLEHYILNGPDPKALDSVLHQLSDPNRQNPQDLDNAVIAHIHQVCNRYQTPHIEVFVVFLVFAYGAVHTFLPFPLQGLPGAFQAALHGVLTSSQLDEAVRATMRCGGCTCSRSSFIGACLGAQMGLEGVPESWKSRTLRYPLLLQMATKVTSLREC